MKPNTTYYRNEVYTKSHRSAEKLIELMGKLGIAGCSPYWFDCQQKVVGFTHRIKGINAFIEETPDEQRCKASQSNTGS